MIRTLLRSLLLPRKTPDRKIFESHRSKIDKPQFLRIEAEYRHVDPDPGFSKYLDLDRWIEVAQNHYNLMNIDPNDHLSILDIGTGAGYFPYVCQRQGHHVMAIDVPGHHFYSAMINLLGVDRRELFITRMVPMPDLGRRFDLVTAFAICFNCHATENLWGVLEWRFFLDDFMQHVLTENGRLFLNFNREPSGEFFSDDIGEMFKDYGALINGDKVIVSKKGLR